MRSSPPRRPRRATVRGSRPSKRPALEPLPDAGPVEVLHHAQPLAGPLPVDARGRAAPPSGGRLLRMRSAFFASRRRSSSLLRERPNWAHQGARPEAAQLGDALFGLLGQAAEQPQVGLDHRLDARAAHLEHDLPAVP